MEQKGYPNLMCFGRDINNCNCKDSCPDCEECWNAFFERYYLFMESKSTEE